MGEFNSLPFTPKIVVQAILKKARETPEVRTLVSNINEIESELGYTKVYLEELKSKISIWDKINLLSTTDEEELVKEIDREIRKDSKSISAMLKKLDALIWKIVLKLSRTNDYVRQFLVWSQITRLQHLISSLSVEVSPFRSDIGVSYSIKGKNKCLRLASEIERFTRLEIEDPVSVTVVLDEVKTILIDGH